MTIQIVKLVTGEELIGEIEQNGNYVIKQPCVLQMIVSRADGTPSMSLIPYAFYVEDHRITVSQESVIWIAKPVDEVYNQYNKIFGTGIQLASASSIL